LCQQRGFAIGVAMQDDLCFAETAAEAWAPVAGWRARIRGAARAARIRIEAMRQRPAAAPFVRCLYAHAVFADTVPTFRAFLRAAKQEGEFVDTPTLRAIIADGRPSDGRFFHLSFDDGFASVYEDGGPVMEDERVPYTMFVATDLIDADPKTLNSYFAHMPAYRARVRTLDWPQAKAAAGGIGEIGCHTRTHARLSNISGEPARLADEIAGAKAIIEGHVGRPCDSFAWPYGTATDIDHRGRAAIAAAGFTSNFSAVRGAVRPGTTDVMDIPRHQVEFHWPLRELMVWARGFREA